MKAIITIGTLGALIAFASIIAAHADIPERVTFPSKDGKTSGNISIRIYGGATHGFDDPGRPRQRVRANAEAAEDALERAQVFIATQLGGAGNKRKRQ